MKLSEAKRVDVGYVNTPLEPMPNLTKELGCCNLYVKRDDMTGLGVGGNKTRKLAYLVQAALESGCSTLLTDGGVQTNHGRLTVAAAAKYGMKSILMLRGPKPEYMSGNLLLDRLMGADLRFVDMSELEKLPPEKIAAAKKAFLKKCTDEVVAEYAAAGEKVFVIPVGGSNIIGAAGYIEAIPEIMRQMEQQHITARHLVAGYGSTGTYAGLVAGAKYYNAPFDIVGIPIEPDYVPLEETVDFLNSISDYYELGCSFTTDDLIIETGCGDDFFGGVGYNAPDSATQSYIELLARTEGCFLDPCYTGKVMHGFVSLIRQGRIACEDGAILLHTGGVPGLWTKEHLDSFQKQYWADEEKDRVRIYRA